MVFSSVIFIFLFLPLTLLGYLPAGKKYRNIFLFWVSLFFYAWGEKFLVLILMASLIVNYFFSQRIAASQRQNRETAAKLFLTLSIIGNLMPLFYFKYSNFAVKELAGLFGPSFQLGRNWKEVALPMGISFYTFQAMSYVIDVYRRDTPPAANFFNFGCYVTCFPQLIAGPIVRYKEISQQLLTRTLSIEKFFDGAQYFTIGLAKKVLIANTVAKAADNIFNLAGDQLDLLTAWLGAISYTLQIYYDFSGYTDMAIGLGLMLGFKFPQNFNHPYTAKSVQEFWHRWHITLSTWFRDYLYIPLGGNRCSRPRTYLNLWIVFLLCGFWHGASWNFILWGAWHGFFLMLERSRSGEPEIPLPALLRHFYALFVIVAGWVLFRADTLPHAGDYLATMFGMGHRPIAISDPLILNSGHDVLLALFVGIAFSIPIKSPTVFLPLRVREVITPAAYLSILFLCLAFLATNTYNPFLYFRF